MYKKISLARRCGQLMTVTLLCFLLLILACTRSTLAATLPENTAILLGFKQYYGDPPKQHLGVDVAYKSGADLYAPVDGTISFLGRVPGSAGLNVTAVTIEQADGSLVTLNPFATTAVSKGKAVRKGQFLGTLSLTGDPSSAASHAHLSLRVNGIYRDPSGLIALALDESKMLPAASVASALTLPVTPPAVQVAPSPSLVPQAASVPSGARASAPSTTLNPVPAAKPSPASSPAGTPALSASPVAGAAPSATPTLSAPANNAAKSGASSAQPLLASRFASSPEVAGFLLARALGAVPENGSVLPAAASVAARVTLLQQASSFLARQSKAAAVALLFAGALLLSATGFGLYQAGRRAPELARCAAGLASQCLQYAMRGASMVSRTFLLRTAPSSSGATSPKEVI